MENLSVSSGHFDYILPPQKEKSLTDFFSPNGTGPVLSTYLGRLEIMWDFRLGACTNLRT